MPRSLRRHRSTTGRWKPYVLLGVVVWLGVGGLAAAGLRAAELLVVAQLAIPARIAATLGWAPAGEPGALILLLLSLVLTGGLLYFVGERVLEPSTSGPGRRAARAWAGVAGASLVAALAVDQAFRYL